MEELKISYHTGKNEFHGFLAFERGAKTKKPAILIAHAWKGLDEFAKGKARELARQGYIAFAADVYGKGVVVESDEEASELMSPLFIDRRELQKRILAAYETLKVHPQVDPKRIGAIGFCFGGLTVIELLRSGADVRGVVSFHGLLGHTLGTLKAKPGIKTDMIKGSLLILHGHDDPLVSAEDISNLQLELTQAKADWQMNLYGHTLHAFTNPEADKKEFGMLYNKRSANRAWLAMENFFNEVL